MKTIDFLEKEACSSCTHSTNVQFKIYSNTVVWNCNETPFLNNVMMGKIDSAFTIFKCTNYRNIFKKELS